MEESKLAMPQKSLVNNQQFKCELTIWTLNCHICWHCWAL